MECLRASEHNSLAPFMVFALSSPRGQKREAAPVSNWKGFVRWLGWDCSEMAPSPLDPTFWGLTPQAGWQQKSEVALCCSSLPRQYKQALVLPVSFPQQAQGQTVTVVICPSQVGFLLLHFCLLWSEGKKSRGLK